MPPPEERPEEGGRRPRKIPPRENVVEPAPSHDGTPCFTAYWRDVERSSRPLFALRIYDVRPEAGDSAKALALAIHQGTLPERQDEMLDRDRDRIEVVALPMALDSSEEQRIEACKSHHMAEVASCQASHTTDFYLPAHFDTTGYWRALIIIDRLGEGWETVVSNRPFGYGTGFGPDEMQLLSSEKDSNQYGSYTIARWALTEWARKEDEEMMAEDEAAAPEDRWGDLELRPEMDIDRFPIRVLGNSLAEMREYMSRFRNYVDGGGLEIEMSQSVDNFVAVLRMHDVVHED